MTLHGSGVKAYGAHRAIAPVFLNMFRAIPEPSDRLPFLIDFEAPRKSGILGP